MSVIKRLALIFVIMLIAPVALVYAAEIVIAIAWHIQDIIYSY